MIDSRAQVFIISLNELNQLLTNHLRAALVLVPGPTIDHKRNCSNAVSAEGVVGAPGEETCEHLVEQLVYQAVPVAVALVRHAADDLAPGLQAVEVLPHVVAFVELLRRGAQTEHRGPDHAEVHLVRHSPQPVERRAARKAGLAVHLVHRDDDSGHHDEVRQNRHPAHK